MVKRIAESLGYGAGTCLKYYCFFSIPSIWLWLPLFALEKYYNKKEIN